ncbi:MAG: hypothetical protein Q9214_004281 [Letrouitia sp. 1 TL-2023]
MASQSHIALDLLKKAHPPEVAAAIFTDKVLHKPLRLRPTSPDPNSRDARAQRRRHRLHRKEKTKRRQRPKPLSAKEKRVTGIYEIPKDAQKYDLYVPLHKMWLAYMQEILGMKPGEQNRVTAQNAGPKIASADYHGSKLMVVRSRCVSLVGLEGIVVRDTKFTFQIITRKSKMKTIPKKYTIFQFQIPQPVSSAQDTKEDRMEVDGVDSSSRKPLIFELNGSQFENRATDRATKKFKQRNLTEI